MTAARSRALRPSQWDLATAPRGVLPLYLLLEAVTVALVFICPGDTPTELDVRQFLALLVVGSLQTELSLSVEKARRYLADGPHISMTSVWMFGGALVLPAALAVALIAIIYLHLWLRVWRPVQRRSAYRVVFSATTVVLGCLAVRPVLWLFGIEDIRADVWQTMIVLAMGVAGLVYTTINGALVAVGIKLHHPTRAWHKTFGSKSQNALELATLSLGGATAVLVVTRPTLAALMLLPVIVLHRNILMRQLEEKAAQDFKTGLHTAEEWQGRLASELARNVRTREPFAGDTVLRAVAATVTSQLRAYDSVGRWGGEEFAVLLPQVAERGARDVAERIRRAVAALDVTVTIDDTTQIIDGLSASVGLACYPEAGETADTLVHAADIAMYRAKRAGRNKVVSCTDRPDPAAGSITPASPPNLRLRPPS
jgi:hypothetical protein